MKIDNCTFTVTRKDKLKFASNDLLKAKEYFYSCTKRNKLRLNFHDNDHGQVFRVYSIYDNQKQNDQLEADIAFYERTNKK